MSGADVELDRITAAQVQAFVDDGYLVVDDLVGEADRAAVLDDIDRFARGDYKTLDLPGLRAPATRRPDEILAVHFPHWVSPTIRSMIQHPRVVDVVTKIAAAHLPFWDGRAKCMQSMLFVKPPGMQGQAWHQDERFIPTRDRSLVGAWIALEDATVENGCVLVLPRSHRNGYLWPTRAHMHPEEFDPSDEAYGFDEHDEVATEVRAGSVLFFNGYLLHRSMRNRGTTARRALVNHYCNAWSLLPWAIPPVSVTSTKVATFDCRRVVPIGDDPYADRGYEEDPDRVFLRPRDAAPEPPPPSSPDREEDRSC